MKNDDNIISVFVTDDINNFDESKISIESTYKIYSLKPLVSENINYDIKKLINFPNYSEFLKFVKNNNIKILKY